MRLSVVMPVRNVAPYLDACIASILGQTYRDLEFIIGDDGSTDGSREIAERWARKDSRVALFESDAGLGPAGSSNWVVAQSRGELVARMDGDDIAHPERLRREIDALDADPHACLVGSLWEGIDPRGRRVRPLDRWHLAHPGPFAPFPHGSIMFRREAFDRVGGYRLEAEFWEDLDLYRRIQTVGRIIVIPAPLYQHRFSLLSTRLTSDSARVEASVDRMYRTALGRPAAAGARLLPRVFVSLGATRLWAGRSPGVLGSLLSKSELRLSRESLLTLIWAAWGAISPGSLRGLLRTIIAMRDRLAARQLPGDRPYRWQCPRTPDHGRDDELPIGGLSRPRAR